MTKYQIDKDLSILSRIKYKRHYALQRHLMNAFFKTTLLLTKPKAPVKRKVIKIKSIDHTELTLYHYHTEDKTPKPILLYFHGGGFQMDGTFIHQGIIEKLITEVNLNVIYVKYRLMPEALFPKPFLDAKAAYHYVLNHMDALHATRIFVAGDSAGGHLAYSMSLYDLHMSHHKIHKTLLIYPVLTPKHEFASHQMYHDTPMWNQTLNKAMWHQYLKQTKTLDYTDLLSYDPKGLKEVYIETAQFDPLRDEGIALEHLLKEAGIHVVAHHTSYTVHGYDAIPLASITKTMMQKRIEFLKETL